MAAGFPWPVTDDDPLLNNALETVMSVCEARGEHKEELVQAAAADLIIEAYHQGFRDEQMPATYALKSLKQGHPQLLWHST